VETVLLSGPHILDGRQVSQTEYMLIFNHSYLFRDNPSNFFY